MIPATSPDTRTSSARRSRPAQWQIGPASIQQRADAVIAYPHVLHAADHDLVITSREPVLDCALQRVQDTVQAAAAGRAWPVPNARPRRQPAPMPVPAS